MLWSFSPRILTFWNPTPPLPGRGWGTQKLGAYNDVPIQISRNIYIWTPQHGQLLAKYGASILWVVGKRGAQVPCKVEGDVL